MFKKVFTSAIAATFMLIACAATQAVEVTGLTADAVVYESGGVNASRTTERVGMGNEQCWVVVYVFRLPELPVGETVLDADLTFKVVGGNDWRALADKGVDLYALRMSDTTAVLGADAYKGDYDLDADATGIQPYIFFEDESVNQGSPPDAIMGHHRCDESGRAALAAWLNACYADPAYVSGGDHYVFLRLSTRDVWGATTYRYWTVGMANSSVEDERPVLTVTTASDLTAPVAKAGPDQTHTTDLQANPVTVTLDGSASAAADSAIQSYAWTEDGRPIATGEVANVEMAVGVHDITLTVTDAEGDSDADSLVVTILDGSPTPPVADAGADIALPDFDGDGFETATLDGSASYATFAGATLTGWAWSDEGGNPVASTATTQLALPLGYHEFTLTVTDSNGLTDTDVVGVNVGREQLMNLPSDRPTFPVPADIVWPENVGEPHICLWYGDKFAAMSITIDDNNAGDVPWWLATAETYDLTLTWYLIVNNIGSSNGGTWDLWNTAFQAGHFIQSHTMSHFSDGDTRDETTMRYEYGQSIIELEANIPGNDCLTIGYPYGNGNIELAREYFIAGRGVAGTPNKPGKINWMSTCSVSGNISSDFVDAVLFGTSGISWLNSTQWMRGWISEHFHYVSDKPLQESRLDYIQTHRDKLWIGAFDEVARFGQERDSAEIAMIENTAAKIAFELTDRMNDQIFDHPLTIKLRIPDAWSAQATATQNGQPIDFSLTGQGDYDYILVNPVPDRGTVEITPAAAGPKAGDANGDDAVDIQDFVILKQNYGTNGGAAWNQGDFNADGNVDIQDFVILKQNYGWSAN